jgi:hypothetical protein
MTFIPSRARTSIRLETKVRRTPSQSRLFIIACVIVGVSACGESSGIGRDRPFADEHLAGECQTVSVMREAGVGAETRDAAVEELIANEAMLASSGVEVTASQILFDGEPVGTVSLIQLPEGGYFVEGASWCHPENT